MEFWFEFASPYSYIAAFRIEALCAQARVPLQWRPFMLGPIFALQGWETSPYVLNARRGAYMYRDLERLTAKQRLPWKHPSVFPRNCVAAARVAAAYQDAPWIAAFVREAFALNFGHDRDLNDRTLVNEILEQLGLDAPRIMQESFEGARKSALRQNTERAIAIGIFGAPTCVTAGELFWGEEALDDAVDWARRNAGAVGHDVDAGRYAGLEL